MIGRIEWRLLRIEQAAAPAMTQYAWQDPGETAVQVIARRFPEGVAPNVRVILYRWASTLAEHKGAR